MSLNFSPIQPPYVFWLGHVVHLHLRQSLLDIYLLLFINCFFFFCSFSLFLSSLKFFLCDLIIFFSDMFGFFSLHFLCMYYKVLVCSYHKGCVCIYMYSFTQLYLALYGQMYCNLSDSSVHVIIQARILEWVVISSSKRSPWPRDWTHISCTGRGILYH